jgi:ubiquinone/menaquinone biosynthesis C-methylase UbiE
VRRPELAITPTSEPRVRALPATGWLYRVVTALSMTVGRGPAARIAAALAEPGVGDTVVDVGCGPGAAAREARRRGADAIGIDPDPLMLGLARLSGAFGRNRGIRWIEAAAESLPLPEGYATVVWALGSLHDWPQAEPGLREARRVLVPGGRLLVLERLVQAGARGHAAHGLTREGAAGVVRDLEQLGFADVRTEAAAGGNPHLVAIHARR